MLNELIIVGNLGKEPEMRYTPEGTPITKLFVIANLGKDKQGNERAIVVNGAIFGQQAETCHQYLVKGQQVALVGEISEPYAYIDQDGKPRARLEMVARLVRFGRKPANNNDQAAPEAATETDIPF